jgi:chromosome segregation ATPase
MSELGEQLLELSGDVSESLKRLQGLIDNRSAWSDGISGCREALAMLTDAATKLTAIREHATQLESDLAITRAANATWSKNHAELSTVEQDLRAEIASRRAELSSLREKGWCPSEVEQELRETCEQQRLAISQQRDCIEKFKSLAKQLSEIA